MRSLVALVQPDSSIELIGQRFYEPRPAFTQRMREFLGRRVYDVGAGCGHVAKLLQDAGHVVEAIDLYPREGSVMNVTLANGACFPYEPDSVVLLARPCHGPFAGAVADHAMMNRGCSAVVYVGKKASMLSDCYPLEHSFKKEGGIVGAAGETMFVWRRG